MYTTIYPRHDYAGRSSPLLNIKFSENIYFLFSPVNRPLSQTNPLLYTMTVDVQMYWYTEVRFAIHHLTITRLVYELSMTMAVY